MKKRSVYIISLLFLLVFSRCNYCECTPENTLAINDTTFNNQFECLDIEFLEKNNQSSFGGGFIYNENYPDGSRKVYIEGGIAYISIDHSRFLSIYKKFYTDGKIKAKCLKNDLGFLIGKFYKFNENGQLAETIDMDKGFDFTFEQLKAVLIRDEELSFDDLVPKNSGGSVEYLTIRIHRYSEPNPTWEIRYQDKDNSLDGLLGTEIIILYDGRNGKQLSRVVKALNP